MSSEVLAYARHKFESGIVQISAESTGSKHYVRLALKRLNTEQTALVSVVSLMYQKKYSEAAKAVVGKLTLSDFERAYALLEDEIKKLNLE